VILLIVLRYAFTFDDALKEAATASAGERRTRMSALMRRGDARQAHPTLEHVLPMYICAGAADLDIGEQLWTFPEGSLSWDQYRFGEVAAE
jgi:4,5-DOPA dioxygenase extradiol